MSNTDDLFNLNFPDLLNKSNQAHVINYTTLLLLLIDKGIITEEETNKARIQATQIVDQEWARRKEEVENEWEERLPGFKAFMNKDQT